MPQISEIFSKENANWLAPTITIAAVVVVVGHVERVVVLDLVLVKKEVELWSVGFREERTRTFSPLPEWRNSPCAAERAIRNELAFPFLFRPDRNFREGVRVGAGVPGDGGRLEGRRSLDEQNEMLGGVIGARGPQIFEVFFALVTELKTGDVYRSRDARSIQAFAVLLQSELVC